MTKFYLYLAINDGESWYSRERMQTQNFSSSANCLYRLYSQTQLSTWQIEDWIIFPVPDTNNQEWAINAINDSMNLIIYALSRITQRVTLLPSTLCYLLIMCKTIIYLNSNVSYNHIAFSFVELAHDKILLARKNGQKMKKGRSLEASSQQKRKWRRRWIMN